MAEEATTTTTTPEAPRPAATSILLRDAAEGLEVLMLKRHGESAVHGGAFVFPGGKVDADDARLDASRLDTSAEAMRAQLAESDLDGSQAVALHVAAVRETFEECGVLLVDGLSAAACVEAGARLRDGMGFNAMVEALDLRLHIAALAPWSRWITPQRANNRRFDTRFFVARLPDDGIACHDGHETTESVWVRPRAALQTYWDGGMTLAPPQILTLAGLARHATVDAAMQAARAMPPVTVQPRIMSDGIREQVMCYPGDVDHPVQGRGLPGPSRLYVRGPRYEPAEGFEGFFA